MKHIIVKSKIIKSKLALGLTLSVYLLLSLSSCIVAQNDSSTRNGNFSPSTVSPKKITSFRDVVYPTETDINFSKKINISIKKHNPTSKYFKIFTTDSKGNHRLFFSGKSTSMGTIFKNQKFNLPLGANSILVKALDGEGKVVFSQLLPYKEKLELKI